jgi:hypothetical protein
MSLTPQTDANPDAIVRITGSGVNASIQGFIIEGASAGTPNLLYGVRVDGGANGQVEFNTITNIINSTTPSFGVAVSVGNSVISNDGLSPQLGTATIYSNTISSYQRAGVVVSNTGVRATIQNNHITGTSINPADSIAGVEISVGGIATVTQNTISSNTNTTDGCGVLLFLPGQGTAIKNNTIANNDYGIFGLDVISNTTAGNLGISVTFNVIVFNSFVGIEFDSSSRINISSNSITRNGSLNFEDGGIFLFNSTAILVVANQSINNNGNGIFVDANSTGNVIQSNTFTGNVTAGSIAGGDIFADAVDLSAGTGSAGSANTWASNFGGISATVSGKAILIPKPH